MNVLLIDENIDYAINEQYKSIIGLIVNALNDYPEYELWDFELYMTQVRGHLKTETITKENLDSFLKRPFNLNSEENTGWVLESIASLKEAFTLMEMYKIDYSELVKEMERIYLHGLGRG